VELLNRGLAVPNVIEIVARQTATLRRLVDDLLDITRIRTGKIPLKRERVNVSDLVQRAAGEANHLIEAGQQELNIQLPSESIVLDADADRLQQVLWNLLSNASKYSPAGSTIDLRAERVGNELLLTVRDTGIGISAEMLPRVFDMFVQADRTLDRSQGGLGIGLTLAQRIVQMHGGSIEAKSAGLGNGSEFSIRLPVIPDIDETINPVNSEKSAQPEPLTILIAEDNRDSAETMAILLRNLGHQVEIAYDGSEALKLARELLPDVFLVDIGLPVLDGYEVAKRVRQQSPLGKTRLLAVTGFGSPDDAERARKAGFDFHLVKPVSFDELQKLLSAIRS
jgi:CheY-like chemotaxis protein/two-component sensor histidine kinase